MRVPGFTGSLTGGVGPQESFAIAKHPSTKPMPFDDTASHGKILAPVIGYSPYRPVFPAAIDSSKRGISKLRSTVVKQPVQCIWKPWGTPYHSRPSWYSPA